MSVKRIYVEKRPPYAVTARAVLSKVRDYLNINSVKNIRILIRYDIDNVSEEVLKLAIDSVFSEPPLDIVYYDRIDTKDSVFSVEYLPGQFDQRADSAIQAVGLLGEFDARVKCATTYILEGNPTKKEIESITSLVLNPVDSRVASEKIPDTLEDFYEEPLDVKIIDGFREYNENALKEFYDSLSLAMTFKDMLHIQNYYITEEKRDPTITEIRIFDTYWSDHCRHTTFSTHLKNVKFEDGVYSKVMESDYEDYKELFNTLYEGRNDKFHSLMDLATIAAKYIKKEGLLDDQEESDEINACSIIIKVDVDGKDEDWLLNFKNETHNHPTEIEPFGGAATCLGGAIRDPLSGRTYCYQAMRISGAADPTVSIEDTIPGKLPQERIVTESAEGYSSYGNQIGLSTGFVKEIYHPGFVAKRMELGAVMAAAPMNAVKREEPKKDDVIILLGGRTGRDGIGGATGSSKAHDKSSTMECGAEVQKGNAPTERKLQRLFRNKEASILIKRCNDFGAGGVSVAIGELADSLLIDLDKVTKKYAGLDGTELSISESQERMAVVLDPKDVEEFLRLAHNENLEATQVATVTDSGRLEILWKGKKIVNIKRSFLDTNGAKQEIEVSVSAPKKLSYFDMIQNKKVAELLDKNNYLEAAKLSLADLNSCSQKGLIERFDSSIGAGSVLYPFGGKYYQTPAQSMIAKIPVPLGKTKTASIMSYGYDPYLSSLSPYHGAGYAILSSMSKVVAAGGNHEKIRFTFQEYFERLMEDKHRWGKPLSALLGAYKMQKMFMLPSIGGKDSMSGSFEDINVPPTLVSFAVSTLKTDEVITGELKKTGNSLYLLKIKPDTNDFCDYESVIECFNAFYELKKNNHIYSAYSVESAGVFATIFYMAIGNRLGVNVNPNLDIKDLFIPSIGDIVIESDIEVKGATYLGSIIDDPSIVIKDNILRLNELEKEWESTLDKVFPIKAKEEAYDVDYELYNKDICISNKKHAKPNVFIPVFPGTNCEFDLKNRFELAGANTDICVLKNNSKEDIDESINSFRECIKNSQIIMFPGGFSAGDEPEGSAKFFGATFRNEILKEEIAKFLDRDGLILGICNGFQALVKLGLLPYGKITTQKEDSPTLTYNTIGRHISKIVYTKVISNDSPWLNNVKPGEIYGVPISHGEGRFVADKSWIEKLYKEGRVATRYVGIDSDKNNADNNPNGSYGAIEGILSPDGRIFGKMAHIERIGQGVGVNAYGNFDMKVFEAGVNYFK